MGPKDALEPTKHSSVLKSVAPIFQDHDSNSDQALIFPRVLCKVLHNIDPLDYPELVPIQLIRTYIFDVQVVRTINIIKRPVLGSGNTVVTILLSNTARRHVTPGL